VSLQNDILNGKGIQGGRERLLIDMGIAILAHLEQQQASKEESA
jgi:hypothetical protein